MDGSNSIHFSGTLQQNKEAHKPNFCFAKSTPHKPTIMPCLVVTVEPQFWSMTWDYRCSNAPWTPVNSHHWSKLGLQRNCQTRHYYGFVRLGLVWSMDGSNLIHFSGTLRQNKEAHKPDFCCAKSTLHKPTIMPCLAVMVEPQFWPMTWVYRCSWSIWKSYPFRHKLDKEEDWNWLLMGNGFLCKYTILLFIHYASLHCLFKN